MAKVELPYKVKNSLNAYITRRVGEKMIQLGYSVKVTKKDIIAEIANHCEVTFENIKRISRNVSQPSLAVAIKIAEYFDTNVENIFKID